MNEIDKSYLEGLGIASWGDNNTPPAPYEVCDISEFWTMFRSYGADDIEFRQITTENGDFKCDNVHIIKYFDRAFMIKVDRAIKDNLYAYVPVCYRLGCIHDYTDEIINNRTGDCIKTCKKCGYSYTYNCGD